jgi:DNA-binding PadR family transcriptional regulator
MKQVQADSQGQTKMGPGALYGSIGRMMEAGLIRESDKRVDPEMDDERRIYYELTGAGRTALEAELNRYRGLVAVAEGRLAHGHYPRGRALPDLVCAAAAAVSAAVP